MESRELLKVEPNDLLFDTEIGSRLRSEVTLTNTSKQRVAFRVQTNNPEVYLVRPSRGFLDAEQTTNVSIELLDRRLFRAKDRFLVLTASCGDTEVDCVQFWQSVPTPVHQRAKIGVRLPPSPAHSPKRGGETDVCEPSIGKATTIGDNETSLEMQMAALREENKRLRDCEDQSEVRMRELEQRGRELEAEYRKRRSRLGSVLLLVDREQHGVLFGVLLALLVLIGIWLTNYLAA
uniref:Major sperm protein n=1 Tax=Plectus sambesii TaxID=2011161 RepID=A0A914VV61_9BILA